MTTNPQHSQLVSDIAVCLHKKFSTSGRRITQEPFDELNKWIQHALDVAMVAGISAINSKGVADGKSFTETTHDGLDKPKAGTRPYRPRG